MENETNLVDNATDHTKSRKRKKLSAIASADAIMKGKSIISAQPAVTNTIDSIWEEEIIRFSKNKNIPFPPQSLKLFVNDTVSDVVVSAEPRITPDIVRSIGTAFSILPDNLDGNGITEEAAQMISNAVEYRMRLIIQESKRFAEFNVSSLARGNCVTLNNVVSAFEMLNIRFADYVPTQFSEKFVKGIQNSSAMMKTLPQYLSQSLSSLPLNFIYKLSEFSKIDQPDQLVETSSYALNTNSVEELNRTPHVTIHWAVVNGYLNSDSVNSGFNASYQEVPTQEYSVQLRTPVLFNMTRSDPNAIDYKTLGSELCSLGIVSQTSKILHALSREHLLLLTHIRNVLRKPFLNPIDESDKSVTEVLTSLRTCPGLSQLIPHLIYFIISQIYQTLAEPIYFNVASGIETMVSAFLALVGNHNVQLHRWIHQILQAIQYIVLHPLLDTEFLKLQDAIALKHFSAQALGNVVNFLFTTDGGKSAQVVSQCYADVICDPCQPITTLLGSVIGIRYLSTKCIRKIILPVLPSFAKLLELTYTKPSAGVEAENLTSNSVQQYFIQELLGAVADVLNEKSVADEKLENLDDLKSACQLLNNLLGDGILPIAAKLSKDSLLII